GTQLFDGLKALQTRYDLIGDVRGGHGLMLAVELVADRASRTPADKSVMARLQSVAYAAGAMVRVSGANIILSPPLVLTDADADVIIAALDAGLASLSA